MRFVERYVRFWGRVDATTHIGTSDFVADLAVQGAQERLRCLPLATDAKRSSQRVVLIKNRALKRNLGRFALGIATVLFVFGFFVVPARGAFGINSLSVESLNKDGSVELRAGAHPYEFEVAFTLNQDEEGEPEGTLRELVAELPAGLVGNLLAVPRCSGADFEGQLPQCPINTQIGVARIRVTGLEETVVRPF